MNKFTKAALPVLAAVMLASCSGSLVNLKYEDGRMISSGARLSYTPAPTNYEPVSVGEPYGYYKKSDMTLYEIKGLDPKDWLTQAYAGSATTIFYSDKAELPTLETLDPNKIFVCEGDSVTVSITTVRDEAVIDSLIDTFINGEYAEWPLVGAYRTYELKFYSEEKYPHIYYNLTYGEFPEGIFLYDRNTKRSVLIGNVLADYIEPAEGVS